MEFKTSYDTLPFRLIFPFFPRYSLCSSQTLLLITPKGAPHFPTSYIFNQVILPGMLSSSFLSEKCLCFLLGLI